LKFENNLKSMLSENKLEGLTREDQPEIITLVVTTQQEATINESTNYLLKRFSKRYIKTTIPLDSERII